MSKEYLLPETGNFYKANLHCHSTYSDGAQTPEELKKLYREHGYSIIAFTDHRVYRWLRELCDDTFLALGGYELDYGKFIDDHYFSCFHLCAIAKDPEHCTPVAGEGPFDYEAVNEAIRQLTDGGFLVALNHPVWSNLTTEDIAALQGFHAMEVYNSGCALALGDPGDVACYNLFLRRGGRAFPIATDDNHSHYGGEVNTIDCCRGYTVFKAPSLTYSDILRAYQSGDFYCSTGPEILSLTVENDRLCIDCSPASAIFLHTKYIDLCDKHIMKDAPLTHAEFSLALLRGKTPYVWLEIADTSGGRAYAVPYYFD